MKKIEKETSILSILDEAVSRLGTVVGHRFWVEEISPGKEDWYDGWSKGYPDEVVDRSKYFDTKEEAEKYMSQMEPSANGNFLRVRQQTCYERVERHWY